MPYKIDRLKIKLPRDKDRRVKLTDTQREEIKKLIHNHSQTEVASMYGVNRTTIFNLWHPEAYQKKREQAKERRKDGRYYNKEIHRQAIQSTRRHRQAVLSNTINF